MAAAVGIDVGGTKIAGGLVDLTTGRVLAHEVVATDPAEALAACAALAARLAVDPTTPIGLGVCELVGRDGSIRSTQTLDWRGRDLVASLRRPFVVESDVRAAALAEARFGAARETAVTLFVTVGTGISHCLLLDGVPFTGATGLAIITGSPPIEEVASGLALQQATGLTRAEDVFADPQHVGLIAAAADALGRTIATLVDALDPERVVIGGGLGLRDDYRAAVTTAIDRCLWPGAGRTVPVVGAALGRDAGVVGAALATARIPSRAGA